jgi:hypothetical protein
MVVVLINQVTTKVGHQGGAYIAPALGESWSHLCSSRIMLTWESGCRLARLVKSTTFRCVQCLQLSIPLSEDLVHRPAQQFIDALPCCACWSWQVRDCSLPNHRRRRPRFSPQAAASPRRRSLGRLSIRAAAESELRLQPQYRGRGRAQQGPGSERSPACLSSRRKLRSMSQ